MLSSYRSPASHRILSARSLHAGRCLPLLTAAEIRLGIPIGHSLPQLIRNTDGPQQAGRARSLGLCFWESLRSTAVTEPQLDGDVTCFSKWNAGPLSLALGSALFLPNGIATRSCHCSELHSSGMVYIVEGIRFRVRIYSFT